MSQIIPAPDSTDDHIDDSTNDHTDDSTNDHTNDYTMARLVGTLSKEIPRIIRNPVDTTDGNGNNDHTTDEVVNMIESLEKGEPPVLLKIVSGSATQDEISDWADSNDIPTEDTDQVLAMLMSSFATGTRIAEKLEADMSEQTRNINDVLNTINTDESSNFNKNQVLQQLDNILKRLDSIRQEVTSLIQGLNSPKPSPAQNTEPNIEPNNYSVYL